MIFLLKQWTPDGRFWPSRDQIDQQGSIVVTKKSLILLSFLYESRYLPEIFSLSSSGNSAKLTSKFWPLLNQPARHGPFRPKLWMALATVFVGIFFRKKFWLGSRPIPVAHWKEFWISWKKWRFQIFQKLVCPYWSSSCLNPLRPCTTFQPIWAKWAVEPLWDGQTWWSRR